MSCTRSWVVVLALGLASGCVAHHNPLPPRPPLLAGKVVTYASGMRVIVEPDPGTKRVAVALLVGAGSAQDPVGHEGLAHFTEHLAFRSRPAKRLTAGEELDFAGVETNAVTGLESTTFTGIMPADRAGQVLPLMASLVTQPLQGIDEPAFEVERNVVRAERYDSDPHSGGVVGAACNDTYAMEIEGERSSIESALHDVKKP